MMGAGLAWLISDPSKIDAWTDLVLPALGGIGALAIWEFAFRPFKNYVWTVPETEHLDAQAELETLRLEGEKTRNPLQRQKSQDISDTLRLHHAEGIKLIHRKVSNGVMYRAWKEDRQRFEAVLLTDMKRLGCSESEIHGAVNIGPAPPVPGDPYAPANRSKGRLVAQLDHVAVVADRHDTTKPV